MEVSNQNYYNIIDNNIKEIEIMLNTTMNGIININHMKLEESESSLDIMDVSMIIMAGFIGGAFSSSGKLEETMHKIHENSSTRNPKNFLGELLHHAGDEIDKGGNFITRNGDKPEFGFHRLFFGHDPLSIKGDNPLILMIKQHGFLSGMLQLCRHLIADTFSKQGLPLPGHSFLDYKKLNGRTGNYLIELTKSLSKGSDANNLEAFNHLFSIRMQDILAQGLTWGIITSYIKFRNIEDKIRISQLKFSAYSISFFTNAISGMMKTGGLPYINWTTLGMMIKESISFFKLNYQEISELEVKTKEIISRNIELEEMVFETGKNIKTFENAENFFNHIKKEEIIFDDLTNFFEE